MLEIGWQASAVRGEEARHFREVASVSIVTAGGLHSVVDTFNCGQPSCLNKLFFLNSIMKSFHQEMPRSSHKVASGH